MGQLRRFRMGGGGGGLVVVCKHFSDTYKRVYNSDEENRTAFHCSIFNHLVFTNLNLLWPEFLDYFQLPNSSFIRKIPVKIIAVSCDVQRIKDSFHLSGSIVNYFSDFSSSWEPDDSPPRTPAHRPPQLLNQYQSIKESTEVQQESRWFSTLISELYSVPFIVLLRF